MVVLGVLLGIAGNITLGELLAFLFLVTLFVGPVQVGTEVLNEAQNAVSGWRRVLGVLDTPADVADPGRRGRAAARSDRGPFDHVSFATRPGPPVLHDIDLAIAPQAAVPSSARPVRARRRSPSCLPGSWTRRRTVLIDGVDLRDVRFSSLRSRIVMVPQDGFLFDATLAENIRFGRPDATTRSSSWPSSSSASATGSTACPPARTPVGQRGESLSAGSGSSSPSPGPTWPTRTCWCSTRRRRRSIRRPRYGSSAPSRG